MNTNQVDKSKNLDNGDCSHQQIFSSDTFLTKSVILVRGTLKYECEQT